MSMQVSVSWLLVSCLSIQPTLFGGDTANELMDDYFQDVHNVYQRTPGDAAKDRAVAKIASRWQKKVWSYIRRRSKAEDIERAWYLCLRIDEDALDELTLAKHCREYLTQNPHGDNSGRARWHLARMAIDLATDVSEVDDEISKFDEEYPRLVDQSGDLRGELRVHAAEIALAAGEVTRAKRLYDEAIDFLDPFLEKEVYPWWKERRERLPLYSKSFDDYGGEDLDGRAVFVKDYRGKVLLIEFWASW